MFSQYQSICEGTFPRRSTGKAAKQSFCGTMKQTGFSSPARDVLDHSAGDRGRQRVDGWMLQRLRWWSRMRAHSCSQQRIPPRCVFCMYQQVAQFNTGCVNWRTFCFPFTSLGSDLLNLHQPITVKLLIRALTNPVTAYRHQHPPRTIPNCTREQ